jgi:hypothetical protein
MQAGQFRRPGKLFDYAATPETASDAQNAAPLPPQTERHNVPQYPLSLTGRQRVFPFPTATGQQGTVQFRPPMTENVPQVHPQVGEQAIRLAAGGAPLHDALSWQSMPYPAQGLSWQPPVANMQAVTSAPLPAIDRQGAALFQPASQQSVPPPAAPPSWQYPGATASPWIEPASLPRTPVLPAPPPSPPPPTPPRPHVTRMEKSTPFIAIIFNIIVLAAIVLLSQHNLLPAPHAASTTQRKNAAPAFNTITNNKEISPLIFGTNMGLFNGFDEPILQSAATRQLLKQIGVRIIRMPTRPTLSDGTEIAAAQAIKEIGAVPLIIINGPEFKGGSVLQTDMHLLGLFTHVFGNETVYYEFGNEADLHDVQVEQYVQVWNAVIPQLKQAYPTARFLGPANSQFDRDYLKTFLQQARPRPDGVSWHEYTCSVDWTAAFCLAQIDMWPIHFIQARAAMREALGTTLPIWITEWNYVSDQRVVNGQPINDGKYNNPTFMQQWTTKAMQTLIAGRVYASMQYFATATPMPLISNNQIAVEGQIFQQEYKHIMVDGYTPPAVTSIPPAPPLPQGVRPLFSFEDGGLDGWSAFGNGITQPVNTTQQAFSGTHALALTLDNASENDLPYITVGVDNLPAVPKAGQMLTAYIYVANKEALVTAKIFVGDITHAWHFAGSTTLTPGQWNKVWYALPMNFSAPVNQIGIQFSTLRPGMSSEVYVDAITLN